VIVRHRFREKSMVRSPPSREGWVASKRTNSPRAHFRMAERSLFCCFASWPHQGVSQKGLPITSHSSMPLNCRAVLLASIKVPSGS
jgi:hypothetical protein